MSNQSWVEEGQKYIMNTYGRLPIAITKGNGARVYDDDGNCYLDFVSGIAVNALGHCNKKIVAAVQKQAAELIHCSNLYWIKPQIELAKLLVENSCMDKVFFGNSGAEANEGAIKLARKYAKAKGYAQRYEIITMRQSFHGRTLATLTATGQDKVQQNFDPLPPGFKYAIFNDTESVKAAITSHTCAIMLEPIQGEGGIICADNQFLADLRAICDENDFLLIYDEVQVGIGRTGYLFAYEYSGVEPDVITLAKALGGGVPIGAVMAKEFCNVFVPGEHASTFGGNPLVTAAGVATISTILDCGIIAYVQKTAAYFMQKLEKLQTQYSSVTAVRGRGLLIGLALDKDGAPIVASCLKKGLLINCTAGTVLRFVPPLVITEDEIDEMINILSSALTECGY